jgi:anti-sigma-K factor RskA
MTPPEDDDDVLAGEYLLGLLEGPDLAAAKERAAADPLFAARVEAWATRLAPLFTGSPAEPPASVWEAISAQLPSNDDEAPARAHASLRRWRFATAGVTALAASLALVLVTRPEPAPRPQAPPVSGAPQSQPVLVASLKDEKTASAVTIAVGPAGSQLLVTPVRLPDDARASELWIIPGDGTPRSLGVIPAAAPSRVAVPAHHRAHIHAGATFAISLEPAGGSPTGAPTGPIAASGKISRV